MVWLFSAGLWLLLGLALVRIFHGLGDTPAHSRQVAIGALILIVLATPLYFRPHEELLGGEDPGAYLNSAVTFARTDHLTYIDPLLVQIPEADRGAFLYGHAMFGLTKDACLWVKDLHTAEIGPWFQPAYSVLLSLPLKVLPAWCVLYGAPLLALLAALALLALGTQLFGRRRGGVLAALFFLLNPVVFWNARSPRAEWGALLFFWLGLALIAQAWRLPGERRIADFLLGAICLFVAPFFHVTAWFGVIPLVLVLLVKAALGRRLFVLIIPVATVGLLGLLVHLIQVTDCYNMLYRLQLLVQHPRLIAAGALLLLLTVLAIGKWLAPLRRPARPLINHKSSRLAIALWLLLLISSSAIWLGRDELGHLPFLPHWLAVYFSMTNLKGLGLLVSRFTLLAALAGWGAWLLWRGAHADLRLGLAMALLPGLLLTGWMNNYMMESRRMLLYPSPIMALCLAALVLWLWERRGMLARSVAAAISLVVLLAMWHGRTHLATHVDNPGLYRALAKIASPIQQAHGWLLAEYSQMGAPMEHLFGIPTLELDSDYHAVSFPQAKRAWAQLMKANPQRHFFFLTPFQPPYSELFVFTPEQSVAYHGPTLVRELGLLPRRIEETNLKLSLYRMVLRTPQTTATEHIEFPHLFTADGSNMSLFGFANQRTETWPVHGLALPAKADMPIPLAGDAPIPIGDTLYFILNGPFLPADPPHLVSGIAGVEETRWLHLADNWWALRLRGTALRIERSVHIQSMADAMLTDVLLHHDGCYTSLADVWGKDKVTNQPTPPVHARWAQPNAVFAMPAPRSTDGDLFIFAVAPDAVGPTMPVRVAGRGAPNIPPTAFTTAVPRWYVFRAAEIGFTPTNPVITLTTDKPWRLNISGFPPELGLLLVYAVVMD